MFLLDWIRTSFLPQKAKEDAKHRTKLFKRSTTLRWTDAEGTDRVQNLVQTRADQDTGGGSMMAPLTPNLVLLEFSSVPLSECVPVPFLIVGVSLPRAITDDQLLCSAARPTCLALVLSSFPVRASEPAAVGLRAVGSLFLLNTK